MIHRPRFVNHGFRVPIFQVIRVCGQPFAQKQGECRAKKVFSTMLYMDNQFAKTASQIARSIYMLTGRKNKIMLIESSMLYFFVACHVHACKAWVGRL